LCVNGFQFIALHRTVKKKTAKRDSGGLVLYFRDTFAGGVSLYKKDCDDMIWVKLDAEFFGYEKDMYVCLCYVLPGGSSRQGFVDVHTIERVQQTIVDIIFDTQHKCHFIEMGDFNARTGVLSDYVLPDESDMYLPLPDDYTPDMITLPRSSMDKNVVNENGRILLEMCKSTGHRILNGRKGRDTNIGKCTFLNSQGESLIDYVICSEDVFDHVSDFYVHDPNVFSDHKIVSFKLHCMLVQSQNMTDTSQKVCTKKLVWDTDKNDVFLQNLMVNEVTEKLEKISNNLTNCGTSNIEQVNDVVLDFTNTLYDAAAPVFEKQFTHSSSANKSARRPRPPWYSDECEHFRHEFLDLLNRFRVNNTDDNRTKLARARSVFKSCARKCRYEYDKTCTHDLLKARVVNAKAYWKLLKNCQYAPKTDVSSAEFAEYFQHVNNPDSAFYTPDEDVLFFLDRYVKGKMQVMFDELNVPITEAEICECIDTLHTGRACGPDLLPNEILVYGRDILAPYLCTLFNYVFDAGIFPETWSEGYITPLLKKGSIHVADNYRGITLLSCLGKLFTKVLNSRLTTWAEDYFVYVEAQAGFRAGMCTTDNIFVLHAVITHLINNGKKLYCAFVDYTKAFDYVVRDNLWYKLIKLGVRGKILDTMRSMYVSAKSAVKINGQVSDSFFCRTGDLQGESVSPFLFSLFVNDLEQEFYLKGINGIDIDMFKMFILLYADDIAVLSESKEDLQMGLNVMHDYANTWKLTVNTSKTKVMVFHKGRLPSGLKFMYGDNELEIVNTFTYLGHVFSTGGSFASMQQYLVDKARKSIFVLEKYIRPFVNLPLFFVCELFDKLIAPILHYNCEVWGFIPGEAIERLHLSFCKKLLSVKRCTQNDFVYGELGRLTLRTTRLFRIIKYWLKVISSTDNRFINIAYNMMLKDLAVRPSKTNWAALVKSVLDNLGFSDAWLNQGVGDVNVFLYHVKTRLRDTYIQNWHSRLEVSNRARLYRHLSENFGYKSYLSFLNVGKFRIAFTKLRCSAHRLQVEMGRWNKPLPITFEERKCAHCHVLEDEFHFVLQCPLYAELRKTYISAQFTTRPNMYKFIHLISSESQVIVTKLATFVYKALCLRDTVVLSQN
jgi:hypothetical protein